MVNTDFTGMLLLLPEKDDIERNKVEVVWKKNKGNTLRIGKFWAPPNFNNKKVKLYGNNMFCLILAQKLGLKLISPSDEFIINLDYKWVKRRNDLMRLSDVDKVKFPCFIKSLVPKLFKASVYKNIDELKDQTKGLEEETKLIVSEIITIEAEVRVFILNNVIVTMSFYEGVGETNDVEVFLNAFIMENREKLVETLVIDVGFIKDRGLAIIETNAVWGAGLNGCDPFNVAKCIAQATKYID